jgi:O-antigen ligase
MKLTALNPGHVLGATLLILLPLSIVSPKGIAFLFIAAALITYFLGLRHGIRFPAPSRPLLILLGGMWLFGAASLVWTIDKSGSLSKLGQLSALLAAGLVLCDAATRLDEKSRRIVEYGLSLGFLFTLILIAVEILAKGPIARMTSRSGIDFDQTAVYGMWFLKNSATLVVILVWPVVVILWRRLGARLILLMLIGFAWELYVIRSASAALAFIAGGGVFALSLRWPDKTMKMLMILVILFISALPILPRLFFAQESVVSRLSGSSHHRLTIWNFAAEKIAEKPLLGWGLDSSRSIPGGKEIVPYMASRSDGSPYAQANEEKLPLHPHNGFLQFWLELGVIGAALGALFAIFAVYRAGSVSQPGLPRAAALATTVAALVVFSLSYGAWQSWWISTLWITAATVIAVNASWKREVQQ